MPLPLFTSDEGVPIKLNVGQDISAATLAKIKYTKPNGTSGQWTGAVSDTNYVLYTTVTGDMASANGTWTIQAYVEAPTFKRHGQKVQIQVEIPLGG